MHAARLPKACLLTGRLVPGSQPCVMACTNPFAPAPYVTLTCLAHGCPFCGADGLFS